MRKGVFLILASFWLASMLAVAVPQAARPQNRAAGRPPPAAAPRDVLDRYCVGCHNQRLQTAALALDTLDVTDVAAHADVWEKVVRKLRTRVMRRSAPAGPTRRRSGHSSRSWRRRWIAAPPRIPFLALRWFIV